MPGSTSAAWLGRQHFDYTHAKDLDAALADLAAGRVDAVAHDKPLLRWKIDQQYRASWMYCRWRWNAKITLSRYPMAAR